MQFEFRTDDNNGSAGIVNAFAEEILTESALFALEHVRKRFKRTIARAGDRATSAAIIDKGINSFLQHTFFIANDDIRSFEFEKAEEAIITIDNAAI